MNVTGLLNEALGSDTVSQISQQLGEDESTTSNAIQAALPMLLGAMASNSSSEEGATSLHNALGDHDGSILGNIGGFLSDYASGPGAGILGHIFGGSEGVAEEHVSQASGLDMGKVGPLLMMLAPIVMGALGRGQRQGAFEAGDLAGILGSAAQQTGSNSSLMGILGQVLDRDHDGSAIDDVAGMIGSILGGRK